MSDDEHKCPEVPKAVFQQNSRQKKTEETADREQCIARGELQNSTAGEYLITGFEPEYGSVYGNGIQAEHTSTACLFGGSKLRARCQRPNEDFEGFADNVMELVENCLSIRKCS